MKPIAFIGDPSRGKDIINTLKSLGGKDMTSPFAQLYGTNEHYVYFISKNNYITCEELTIKCKDKYNLYTIEEFKQKFPFKVGDKVTFKNDDYPYTIKSFSIWNDEDIVYELEEKELNAIR